MYETEINGQILDIIKMYINMLCNKIIKRDFKNQKHQCLCSQFS